MAEQNQRDTAPRPAGYSELIARFGLKVIPNWHSSYVSGVNRHLVTESEGAVEEIYPARYWPGPTVGDHLEFALKYDGTDLGTLAATFRAAPEADVLSYVESKPRGKYARRIWYLYELLTGSTLPLADLHTGGYIPLLDDSKYYTTSTARRVRRQRIDDNLLGGVRFCPMVRRTEALLAFEQADLPTRCRQIVSRYSPELIRRAMGYLYAKETKSSFEIEHITPSSSRTGRFVALLKLAEQDDFCGRDQLIELQNRIVDPRFRDTDYRQTQNYVGETISLQRRRVHFVGPKPEEVGELMAGLLEAHQRMEAAGVQPVVHAAVIAYCFVFLHPFEDGNGRIHRFLIHNILARRGFTPSGVVFPVSAAMLKDMTLYDASLESFSRPLMELVEYSLDDMGQMTVHNDTSASYRLIDMTSQTEALFRFMEQTIDTELVEELEFLQNYDQTKTAIQEIVDMPDRQIDLFIRFCLRSNGRLSARKRSSHFAELTDQEVQRMEDAVRSAYASI